MARERRPLNFFDGVGVGLGVVSIVLLALFAVGGNIELVTRSGREQPMSTQIVTSELWRVGTPIAVVLILAAVRIRRPANRLSILAVGVTAALVVAASYYGTWVATHDLFGDIAG